MSPTIQDRTCKEQLRGECPPQKWRYYNVTRKRSVFVCVGEKVRNINTGEGKCLAHISKLAFYCDKEPYKRGYMHVVMFNILPLNVRFSSHSL